LAPHLFALIVYQAINANKQNGLTMQRILVVEDDPEISAPLIKLLQHSGFIAILCERGDHVVNYVQRFNPSLILLDLSLPFLSGMEICQTIRCNNNVPIIIITAKINPLVRIQCFELGADDFVNKPFSMAELVLRINAVIKRSIPVKL